LPRSRLIYAAGASVEQIGNALGISKEAVYVVVRGGPERWSGT
jgi:hypothetical protein